MSLIRQTSVNLIIPPTIIIFIEKSTFPSAAIPRTGYNPKKTPPPMAGGPFSITKYFASG